MRFPASLALILLALVTAFPPPAVHAQTLPAELEPGPCEVTAKYRLIDILDPDYEPDAKKTALAELEARTAEGCAYDGYVLGTLLRHGRALPGNLVERDPARAERLIEAFARTGYVRAYADLAEMALTQNDARSAMKWAQVYLSFRSEPDTRVSRDFDRRGYNANLLMRADAAWRKGRINRNEIAPLLNGYLNAHRATVLAGLAEESKSHPLAPGSLQGDAEEAPELVPKSYPGEIVRKLSIEPGYAIFLLEIQPDGRVSRIVAESFGPSADTPAALKPLISGVSFEPFKGSEPQIARVPVVYGYSEGGPTIKN